MSLCNQGGWAETDFWLANRGPSIVVRVIYDVLLYSQQVLLIEHLSRIVNEEAYKMSV